jgi:hypothetical protein
MRLNTQILMDWCDRMVAKYGQPKEGCDWCRKLAYAVGEAGNDSPSDYAILIAMEWEKHNPEGGYGDETLL